MTRILGTVSLIALAAAPALAQDAMELDEITIFANQTLTDLNRSGANVDILGEATLRDAGTTQLADTLAALPGLTVASNGGIGGVTILRMRGLSGPYSPVMVNGIDVTDPSGVQTQFDWANLSLGNVTRVEVVKGAQSAVHGSEAVGGIIDVTTNPKRRNDRSVEVFAEGGSYNTRRGGLSVNVGDDRGALSFGLTSTKTDGFSARVGGTEDDGYEGTQLTLGGEYDVTDTLKLGFDGYWMDSTGDYDASAADETGISDATTRALRVYGTLETGAVTHNFSASHYEIDRSLATSAFTGTYKGERDTIDYKAAWTMGATALTFGGDWTREKSDTLAFGSAGGGTAETTGIFAEANFAPSEALDLTVSLRHDDHDAFGGHNSARAALAWRPTANTTVRALVSSGFRAPSLYELYDPWSGNAALEPEKSRNAELSVEHAYRNGANVKATLFYSEIDNLIQYFDPDGWLGPLPGAYAQRPGTTVSQGVELSGAVPVSDRVSLTGAFTYTDSRDASDNPQLRIPRYDLALGVDAEITNKLNGSITLRHAADFPDEFGTPLTDFTVVNAQMNYAFSDSLTGYLRVENLTDADYQTAAGYNTAGRSWFLGVRASF
ncbi:TonB-dependent receptor [Mesobacterium sp. TK19101]|uniref:TonB-dependent receptor n=1 Tax=Mesobacterium hydrothermale TaxID=3111907 RepID=A0ABU6HBY4_9RHOB|nr:TonB-dependent receptor [Mesobacterium sp. TK19101]MEC3859982.1 TonB-dependent receptor [Mesobacterium sp. TK19101]